MFSPRLLISFTCICMGAKGLTLLVLRTTDARLSEFLHPFYSLALFVSRIHSLAHPRTHARTHTSTPAHPHPHISTHAGTRARCKHTHISIRYRYIHFPSLPFLFLSSLPPLPLHSSFLKHTIDLANESNRDKLNYYSGVHQHPFCTAALRLNKNSHLSLSPAPYPRYLSGEDPVLGGTLVTPLIDGIQNHVMVSFPSKTV